MFEPVTTARGILCLCRCLTSLSAPENTELINMSMKFHDHTLLEIFKGTSASFLLVVMLAPVQLFCRVCNKSLGSNNGLDKTIAAQVRGSHVFFLIS